MTKRVRSIVSTMAVLLALAATGCEKPQTADAGKRKDDTKAWQGAQNDAYVVQGWKEGDQASWEQQIRARTQGQNEYSRTTSSP